MESIRNPFDKWPLERTKGCPCKQDPFVWDFFFHWGFFYTYKGTKQLQALMYLFRKTLYQQISSILGFTLEGLISTCPSKRCVWNPCPWPWMAMSFHVISWLHKLPPYLLKRFYNQPESESYTSWGCSYNFVFTNMRRGWGRLLRSWTPWLPGTQNPISVWAQSHCASAKNDPYDVWRSRAPAVLPEFRCFQAILK